MHKKSYPLSTL